VLKFDGTSWGPGDNGGGNSNVNISECTANDLKCNTAVGVQALPNPGPDGNFNTAVGAIALNQNSAGTRNSAIGYAALNSNASGSDNTALGMQALGFNTSGSNNTALGVNSLLSNSGGSNNIAVGFNAGSAVGTGDFNILLGNDGVDGESRTIRIGTPNTHLQTFIAGISVTGVSGAHVLVSSDGQLGVELSSRRYKEDIRDMGEASNDLLRLRPVTFRYKQAALAGERPREYGLIAEEVAEVYPDLVVHSATGEIETVQYHKLVPMLLNELQKQHQQLGKQEEELSQLKARLAALERLVPAKESLAQWSGEQMQ
jgi:hypothetical protein